MDDAARDRFLDGFESRAPISIWIDDAGLPRRIRYAFLLKGQKDTRDACSRGAWTTQTDYYDYSVPVRITVPDPSSVVEMDERLAQRMCHGKSKAQAEREVEFESRARQP